MGARLYAQVGYSVKTNLRFEISATVSAELGAIAFAWGHEFNLLRAGIGYDYDEGELLKSGQYFEVFELPDFNDIPMPLLPSGSDADSFANEYEKQEWSYSKLSRTCPRIAAGTIARHQLTLFPPISFKVPIFGPVNLYGSIAGYGLIELAWGISFCVRDENLVLEASIGPEVGAEVSFDFGLDIWIARAGLSMAAQILKTRVEPTYELGAAVTKHMDVSSRVYLKVTFQPLAAQLRVWYQLFACFFTGGWCSRKYIPILTLDLSSPTEMIPVKSVKNAAYPRVDFNSPRLGDKFHSPEITIDLYTVGVPLPTQIVVYSSAQTLHFDISNQSSSVTIKSLAGLSIVRIEVLERCTENCDGSSFKSSKPASVFESDLFEVAIEGYEDVGIAISCDAFQLRRAIDRWRFENRLEWHGHTHMPTHMPDIPIEKQYEYIVVHFYPDEPWLHEDFYVNTTTDSGGVEWLQHTGCIQISQANKHRFFKLQINSAVSRIDQDAASVHETLHFEQVIFDLAQHERHAVTRIYVATDRFCTDKDFCPDADNHQWQIESLGDKHLRVPVEPTDTVLILHVHKIGGEPGNAQLAKYSLATFVEPSQVTCSHIVRTEYPGFADENRLITLRRHTCLGLFPVRVLKMQPVNGPISGGTNVTVNIEKLATIVSVEHHHAFITFHVFFTSNVAQLEIKFIFTVSSILSTLFGVAVGVTFSIPEQLQRANGLVALGKFRTLGVAVSIVSVAAATLDITYTVTQPSGAAARGTFLATISVVISTNFRIAQQITKSIAKQCTGARTFPPCLAVSTIIPTLLIVTKVVTNPITYQFRRTFFTCITKRHFFAMFTFVTCLTCTGPIFTFTSI